MAPPIFSKQYITLVALLISLIGFSQLSTTHYIPPITAYDNNFSTPQDHYIYISTPSTNTVNFTITPIGSSSISGTVSNAIPYVYNIGSGYNTQFIINPTTTSNILNNKGYVIEADSAIYVSVRVNTANQAGALVSKGTSALGQTFRVGGFTNTNTPFLSFVSVMATQDNTQITFSENTPSGITLTNYSGTLPITIILNAGESYVLSATGINLERLIGCLVQANKPIVVNCGSTCGSFGNDGSKKDYGIDQIVGLNRVGTEYIFVKGTGGNDWENVLIVAHTNATSIFINGNTTPLATINAGEHYLIEGHYYSSNDNMYVETSNPVFAYQGVGTDTTKEQNQGMFFVPPLNCETKGNLNNIAYIERIGNVTYSGGLSIVTKAKASLTINGQALSNYNITGPNTVAGNTEYVSYKVTNLSGNISVESTEELYCAYFNSNNNATSGSFYSGFPSPPEISFDTDDCFNAIVLTASNFDAFDSIEWAFNGTPTGVTTQTYTATQLGTYKLIGTISCTGSTAESNEIDITSFATLHSPVTLKQCPDNDATSTTTYFNLTEAESALFTGTANVTFSYYETESAAENGNQTSPYFISNPKTYTAKTNTAVWVRAVMDNPDCFDVQEITLEISSTKANNAILNACDNDDGIANSSHTFNLSNANSQVLQGLPSGLNLSYYETYNNALSEDNPITQYTVAVNTPVTIYARVENANDCYAISEVTLNVYSQPNTENETLHYCLNQYEYYTFNAGPFNDTTAYTYLWSTGETSYSIDITEGGTYTVTITNANNCSSEKTINVETSNVATIESVDILDNTENNTVTVNTSGQGSYQYALIDEDNNFVFPYQDSNTFEQVPPGVYNLYVKDTKNDCGIASQLILVIGFPKFFSPNNDGINDTWHLIGVENIEDITLNIYNRHGKLLKTLNTIKGWDGTYNNSYLPADDYWFTAHITRNGNTYIIRDHFALLR